MIVSIQPFYDSSCYIVLSSAIMIEGYQSLWQKIGQYRMSTTSPPKHTSKTGLPKKRFQTFRALRYRNFRLIWISLIVSSVGTWLQIVTQSLLVLQIAHGSSIALGAVSLAQAASFFLFAFIGGSIADQSDKRRFLLITQSLS